MTSVFPHMHNGYGYYGIAIFRSYNNLFLTLFPSEVLILLYFIIAKNTKRFLVSSLTQFPLSFYD